MTSEQLSSEPRRARADKEGSHGLRPVMTVLGGDSSWQISPPRPSPGRADISKASYHIVPDPWLIDGPTVLGSSRIAQFSRHAPAPSPSSVPTAAFGGERATTTTT